MSRETDSSSAGPQGRGGAAYPSGTPPYGSRQYPSLHPQDASDEAGEAAPEQQPEEKKTETTLTTRIRINIPGSRPIPPVVMRTPMSDVDAGPGADTSRTSGSGTRAGTGPGSASASTTAASERESERTGGTPRPGAPAAGPSAPAAEGKPPASDWFAPRRPAAGSPPAGATPGPGAGAGAPAGGMPGPGGPSGGPGGPGGGPGAPQGPGGPGGRSGPGGPGAGSPRSGLAALADQTGGPAAPPGPGGPPGGRGPGNGFAPPPGRTTPPPGAPDRNGAPAGPTAGPATGDMPLGPRTGSPAPGTGAPSVPRMSDDTAVLTPQRSAPEGGGHVSGDTLTSGMPVVPGAHRSPFAPLGGPDNGPGTGPNPILAQRSAPPAADGGFSVPEFPAGPGGGPVAPDAADRPAPRPAPTPPPARKGRSKLVLAGAGVVGLLGIAYGAGLLLNHSDVPKSTTVLGVDIGGGTKDEAVNKLEAAFGERAKAPLQLSIDGKKAELPPDKAGLSLDSQATVRGAAGSDYNPVSVIGSLFGGERVAPPMIVVDEEKLSVALADLAGGAGPSSDGTIRFEPGKAVAVPGKPGKALDVGRAMISVKDAYRAQVQTGAPNVVELPVTTREPTITQAELDRAMKEFAEPAMSGLITIKAGSKSIQFGPTKSLPKILSVKAIDGRLVEVYDKEAIDTLLEGVFDGIMITKGDGKKHEVSPDDVAAVMGPALRGKTPAERTAVIELNPS
ncbi:hypothetical protein [Streptomyces peucetius]|uniref:Peptidoglycan binding domain-containing protein n=1 Tax=Streptomyces peucetius TaxID=1950 RepID=A0ABY6IB36_STRPE|nr:hypothetical protein [Streptomyces peucetius]UYQ64216.1 hypothetical protein OGH68_23955 [Streptomyces peucetius]